MIFPEVRSLYKYMPINENSLGCIIKNEFWFSKPAYFNDPLDCGIQLLNQIDKNLLIGILESDIKYSEKKKLSQENKNNIEKYKSFLAKIRNDNNPNIQNLSNDFQDIATHAIEEYSNNIQKIGILSLSEINNNILMWSHYSEQHKGICIEFERSEDSILADNNKTLPVRYSIQKPLISISEEILGDIKLKREIKRSLIYTKSVDWNYEREWRVINEEGNISKRINSRIKTIYFGVKTPDYHKKTIERIVDGKGIKLRQMFLNEKEFGLHSDIYNKNNNEKMFFDLRKLKPQEAWPFPAKDDKKDLTPTI